VVADPGEPHLDQVGRLGGGFAPIGMDPGALLADVHVPEQEGVGAGLGHRLAERRLVHPR
jgi:hypothetical protein